VTKKDGWSPYTLATILRIHLQPQWYSRSDSAMEVALIEIPTRRRLAGIDLISDRTPNKETIPTFCHLLKKCELAGQIFEIAKSC